MDSKRKRQQDEREREEKALEECVLKILRHGDANQLTESKVRKLAASETGFDLTDPGNRKIVKRTVETYFSNYQEDGSRHEKKAQAKAVAHKAAARPSPKPERRRKLVTFDDDEEEEDAEPAKRGPRANGSKQLDDDEGNDVSESEEEDGKRSSRVTTKKKAEDSEGEEETERVNRNKHAAQGLAKRRHLNSDEEESDAEEEEEKSSHGKNAASVRNKQARKAPDDDTLCQLSKNRFVSVQDFKGTPLVSIREYYEKDGKQLPTRKGISLTVDQWEALKEGIPDIEAAIQKLK